MIKVTEPTGLPVSLTIFLQSLLSVNAFIETGTGLGRTTNVARQIFPRVYTIEAHEGRYRKATERFAGTNVTCVMGESPSALRQVLAEIEGQAIVFLDAHCAYRDSVTGCDCPLLSEIEAVWAHRLDHIVIVDDEHFFTSPPPKREHWNVYPELIDVVNALHNADNPYTFIEDKCIISVPRAIKPNIGNFLRRDKREE